MNKDQQQQQKNNTQGSEETRIIKKTRHFETAIVNPYIVRASKIFCYQRIHNVLVAVNTSLGQLLGYHLTRFYSVGFPH